MVKLAFDYQKILRSTKTFLSRYRTILTSLAVLGVISFTLLHVTQLIDPEPNEDRYNEQLTSLKKIDINENTVKKIKSLNDSNVNVDPRFNGGRRNPFSE